MRKSGRTTKLVNEAIDEFFNKGFVLLVDHHWDNKQDMQPLKQNQHIKEVFMRRLYNEHTLIVEKHYNIAFNRIVNAYEFIKI